MKTVLFVSLIALSAAACGHANTTSSVKDSEDAGNQPTPASLTCSGSEDGATDPAFASMVVTFSTDGVDGADGPSATLKHMVSGFAGPAVASSKTYACKTPDGFGYTCQDQTETDSGETVQIQYIPLAGHNVARIFTKSFVGSKQKAVLNCDK